MSQHCEEMLHPVIPVSPAPEGACRGAAACTAALAEAAGQARRPPIQKGSAFRQNCQY